MPSLRQVTPYSNSIMSTLYSRFGGRSLPGVKEKTSRKDINFNMPSREAMPTFSSPEYDEGEVRKLTQQHAAPGRRELMQGFQKATSKHFDNPNVEAMVKREALQGVGGGLEQIMEGAGRGARAEYAERYGRDYETALRNYEALVNRQEADYQSKLMAEQIKYQKDLEDWELENADWEEFMGQYESSSGGEAAPVSLERQARVSRSGGGNFSSSTQSTPSWLRGR